MNFYDGLEQYGNQIALIDSDGEMCYSDLAKEADLVAASIQPRSLVFLLCKNVRESVIGYLGMLRRRAVPVMLSPSLNASLYKELVSIYRPQYVWCPDHFSDGKVITSYKEYTLIDTGADAPQLDEHLAVLLTTSGSTGSPKLVRQSYANINSNTASIVEYLNICQQDRAITTLPMNYTFGLSILQTHLAAGAKIILTEKTILEKEFWALLKEKQATTFGGVPYTFQMLDKLRFLRMELPSLSYITQAGGKLSKELHYKFADSLRKSNKALIVMYGATEATARMSYVPAAHAVEKAGSIGIPIPGGSFELTDTDGQIIHEPHKAGELVYYGENVTMGYAQCRDDLAKKDERGGKLETGDIAFYDEDGYYYIAGRKSRFLKIYGNRVNLMEIEDALSKKGYECACVGEDDHMRIYTTFGDTKQVEDFISDLTHINKSAFSAVHIDLIPRNASGKILYSELK